jgi:hypothetical protein
MPGKSLPFTLAAVTAAALLTGGTTAPPAPAFSVSAAVLPGGGALPGGTYAIVRGTDGHVYIRDIQPAGKWLDTRIPIGANTGPGVFVSPPVAPGATQRPPRPTSAAPKVDVSVMSTNTAGVAMSTINDSDDLDVWEDWYALGGKYTSALGVDYDKNFSTANSQVIFYAGRGTDSKLYCNGTSFGTVISAAPVLSYSAVYRASILTFRGTDGNLYRMVNGTNGDSHYFNPPVQLGTAMVGSAASVPERSLRYYYRGTDGALWMLNGKSAGATPVRLGGSITSTPYALDEGVAGEPDRANVFARGSDGALYVYNTGTKRWASLGGSVG